MKKLTIISIFAAGVALVACSDVRRSPGRVYMPDMAYSRAYETYSVTEEKKAELLKQGIHYTNVPVAGTVKRGQDFTFRLAKDSTGDTTIYHQARDIVNPIVSLDSVAMKEAERLYLINCGICHGTTLNGNGPLWKDGAGPYPAAPKNLMDAGMIAMPDGQMFYSVTYGKGAMGSYASQLNSTQRWMVIHYVKSKQKAAAGGTSSTGAATDTAKATQPAATTAGGK